VKPNISNINPWQLLKVVVYAGANRNLLWANVQLDRSVVENNTGNEGIIINSVDGPTDSFQQLCGKFLHE
jgi:hypothetical protein